MPKRKSPLDPNDVLSGRVKVTLGELLDLIHRVNPTGRDLDGRDLALRYALKSRLQSLLVRRFGSELEVAADPEQEGTVLILHRGHGRDGCHAVLDALDEDARAWVRLQLDLGPPSSAEARPRPAPAERASRGLPPPQDKDETPPSADASPDSLLRRADESLASYDYEHARARLERAVAASGGAPEPAAALLALLVDTLGDDAGALALPRSLARAALAHPDVRGLLALAEARAGDPDQAMAWMRGANDTKAAATFAALAAHALAAGDVERASGQLAEVRRRDAAHPSIVGLGREIARLQAEARGPAEAELASLVAAGHDGEAEKKAVLMLARWPESEAARRALRTVEDRRRRAEIDRHAAEADAAFAAGNTAEARARLARALAAARGPEREALERRVRAVEAADREAREALAVERVTLLLGAADLREGLVAYLELDEARRARVLVPATSQGATDAVRWLDHTGRGAAEARVAAVLALGRARIQLAAGEAEAALATVGPHGSALDRVPAAKQLVREARALAAAQRAVRAGEAVAAAKAALATGGAVEALRLLDEATLRDLPEPERAAATALRAEAAARAARAERLVRLGQLRAAGKLFEARRVAEDLAADAADEGERARWQAERRAIQAAIQRELCVEVDEEPTPLDLTSMLAARVSTWEAQRWLAADGRSMVMAEAHGAWVLVHLIDIVDRTVRARVVLRAPEPTGDVLVEVTGDVLWLLGARGVLLGLSRSTWEVKVQRSSADVLPHGTRVTSSVFPVGEGAAAPRFLWIEPRADETSHCVRVVDLSQHRPAREVPEPERISALRGVREPRVACFRAEAMVLHEDRGTAVPGGRIDLPGALPIGAVLHPDGRSLVLLALIRPKGEELQSYAWVVVPEGGPPGALHRIEGADGDAPARLAAAVDAGIVAIHFSNPLGWDELLVLGAAPDGLAPLYRVPMCRHFVLVQDARSRKLLTFEGGMDQPRIFEIGATLPDIPSPSSTPTHPWIHHVIDVVTCLAYSVEGRAEIRTTGEKLKRLKRSNLAVLTRQYQERAGQTSDEGFAVVASLEEAGPFGAEEARRLLAWLWERYPNEPEARLQRANRLARAGRWEEVERLFNPSIDSTGPRSAHFYHLLGLAALHAGYPERARARVDEALSLFPKAQCIHLKALAELLAPPPETPAPPTEAPSLAQLADDAGSADRCLARGDAAGALSALSSDYYWTGGDVQIFARMAEAHLRLAPARGRERFRKIMALAKFVEANEEKDPERRRDMPLPGGTWNRARLDTLAARARDWLDEQSCVEGSPGDRRA